MEKSFVKKSGTTSKGYDYEDLLITRILFKLAHDNDVEDFTCSSNVNDNRSLDDLVLDIKYKDNNKPNETFYLQLKHKGDGNRNITKNMLAAVGGNFSLQKYCKCWETINRSSKTFCGIYSSGIFDPDPKYVFTFKLLINDHQVIIKAVRHLSRADDIFNTSKNNFFYTFEIEHSLDQNSCSEEEKNVLIVYQDFFEHFRLYANQQPLEALKISTLELFKGKHDCEETSFAMFKDFISEWSRHEGKKNCLSKEVVKFKIAETLLKPYIKIPDFSQTNSALTYFRKACLENDVTLIEDNDIHIEEKILNMFETPTESKEFLDTGKNLYVISEKVKSIDQLEDMQKNIIMWHMKKLPVIIRIFDVKNLFEIIRLCWEENNNNRKFILIGKNIDKNEFSAKCKLFSSLQDLNPVSDVYKNIVEKMIVLQDREPVSLNALIEKNEDVKQILTTQRLIEMSISPSTPSFAHTGDKLPDPYIQQFLPKVLIDISSLWFSSENDIFIISCYKNVRITTLSLSGFEIITAKQFLMTNQENKSESHRKYLIFQQDGITAEEFRAIYEKNPTKSYHHFKIQENRDIKALEWISSYGNIETLQKYVIQKDYIQAKKLLGFADNKVNIICAKPGSGKSIFLKYLQFNWPLSYWTIYINFREYILYFHKDQDPQDIFKSILEFQSKKNTYNSFEKNVRDIFVKNEKIVIFWDGLDELPPSHCQLALNTIKKLTSLNIINWIASRDFLKPMLEQTFNVFSFSIKEMDKSQQEDYIKEYLRSKYDDNELKIIVDKIIKIISVNSDNDFLGIPLQIAMLTELFHHTFEKYKTCFEDSSTFTLSDVIYYFLEERIRFYFQKRGQCDINDNFIKNTIEDVKEYKFLLYEMLALKTFLPADVFKNLQLNAKKAFSVFEKRHDDFGIITQINEKDECVTFTHNIFAEFFVASWMVEHLEHVSSFKHFFFEDTFRTIRMLFDMMLAKNCPLHQAVLARDFSNVQKYEELIDQRDIGGRNPLHLVCSWGKMRPVLKTQKKNDTYEIDMKNDNSIEDSDEYRRIITFLVKKKKVNTFEKDDLFQWTFIDYANESFSLLPLDVIIENHGFEERVLKKFDIPSLLYYCVKFNYRNIFNSVDMVYLESIEGLNLLHLSLFSKNGSWFIEHILRNEEYLKKINHKTAIREMSGEILFGRAANHHSFPLHFLFERKKVGFRDVYESLKPPLILAASAGNEEAIMILLDKGADINVCDESQNNALYYAVQFQHKNIIKLLIEKGIDKNQTNRFKDNVLHISTKLAIIRQYYLNDIVEYLLREGVLISFNKQELCPLSYATMAIRRDILDLLLTYGKFFDKKKEHIRSSFIKAVRGNIYEIVKYFIQYGVDTNTNCDLQKKTTALHVAVMNGNTDIANLLLENRANIDACDCEGKTPLHFAVMLGNIDMVKLLVAKGATLTKVDYQGLAPIWNVFKNYATKLDLILTYSAEGVLVTDIEPQIIESRSNDQEISKRLMNDDREIFTFLVEHGVDVNVSDKNGMTFLEHLEQNGYNDIIQFLSSKKANRIKE